MATYMGKYTSAVCMPCTITLISKTYTTDAYGQSIESETTKAVKGYVASVSANENERAAQNGLIAAWEATLWAFEYNDEMIVEVKGKRYSVYRYYFRSDGRVELYLGKRAGVVNGANN